MLMENFEYIYLDLCLAIDSIARTWIGNAHSITIARELQSSLRSANHANILGATRVCALETRITAKLQVLCCSLASQRVVECCHGF